MNTLYVLTVAWESLSLGERQRALLLAREAGRRVAVDEADDLGRLERGDPLSYQRHIVDFAADEGVITAEARASWEDDFRRSAALTDPRVNAFLFGWHERAVQLMAGQAPEDFPPSTPQRVHARWFLRSLETYSGYDDPDD